MAKKGINIIIALIIVVTCCLVIFSATYAWFLMSRTSSDVNNASKGGSLDIIYRNGQDIKGTLVVSKDNSQALTTTATIKKASTSVDALATVTINVNTIAPELAIKAFKWEVYQDNGTTPIKTGTFNGVTNGSKINVIEDYRVMTTDTTFTVKLWLNGNETTGSLANKAFSGYIDASAINAPATVS